MPLDDITLAAFLGQFRSYKGMAERGIAQLRDDDLFVRLNPQQSSIFAYMQHISGNLKSRFSDFLTSDGEKPSRDREGEFEEKQIPRSEIMAMWEAGWKVLFDALASLQPGDLEKTITIRNEPHTVVLAIARSITHISYHVGQILLLAKHIKTTRGENWNYLTIAPGGTKQFNRARGV
jgi:Protein of unknown function (DUF1572)